MRSAFGLLELLVTLAIAALLAAAVAVALPQVLGRADAADALAKIRQAGAAVLHYTADHQGSYPPLFPGQVLEYERGRGGRIVTECAAYLDLDESTEKYLVTPLLARAYARATEPADKNAMRVYVMNAAVTNNGTVINPFGRVTTPGQPPTGHRTVSALAGAETQWMMSTADRLHPQVASAPWKNNTPPAPPLGHRRVVFRFDGAGELVNLASP